MAEHEHELRVRRNIEELGRDSGFRADSVRWISESAKHSYSYNFSWLGRPIVRYPQDIVAMQELIWQVKPDLIIETGIAHGGSLVFSASMLALLDLCDKAVGTPPRHVIGIDVEIRPHNRKAIEVHPLADKIMMIEGSSIAPDVIAQVRGIAERHSRVLVCLDSMHTHDQVLSELEAYAPLVSEDSYCVVFDTIIDDLGADAFPHRPWGPGNNPKTAVWAFLKSHAEFEIDRSMHDKLQFTVAPDGFLRRVRT